MKFLRHYTITLAAVIVTTIFANADTVLTPSKDAFINNVSTANAKKNFGSADFMITNWNSSGHRYAVFSYDISAVDFIVTGVKLSLQDVIGGAGTKSYEIYGLLDTHDRWDESTLTFNNAGFVRSGALDPSATYGGAKLGDFKTAQNSSFTAFDDSTGPHVEFVNANRTANGGNGIVTYIIVDPSDDVNGSGWATKESTKTPATLTLTGGQPASGGQPATAATPVTDGIRVGDVDPGKLVASASAPILSFHDISNLVPSVGGETIAVNQPGRGNTFLSDKRAGTLKAVTVRISSEDETIKGGKEYLVRIGTVTPGKPNVFTQVASSKIRQDADVASNAFFKFELGKPVALKPDMLYGFEIVLLGPQARPGESPLSLRVSEDSFSGGQVFASSKSGGGSRDEITLMPGDLVFHLRID